MRTSKIQILTQLNYLRKSALTQLNYFCKSALPCATRRARYVPRGGLT
eukprot:SAG11_NODE_7_length_31267_cov_19.541966_23_plen_48_part_00